MSTKPPFQMSTRGCMTIWGAIFAVKIVILVGFNDAKSVASLSGACATFVTFWFVYWLWRFVCPDMLK